MKYYVLVHVLACDWPQASRPKVFTDRAKAADTWRLEVLELAGYPDDDPDPDVLVQVGSDADNFLMDMELNELEWTAGGEGSIGEMTTIQLFVVEES